MHTPNSKLHSEVLPARRAWHRTALGVARLAGVVVAIIALSACVYVTLLPAQAPRHEATPSANMIRAPRIEDGRGSAVSAPRTGTAGDITSIIFGDTHTINGILCDPADHMLSGDAP